jgi:hypothetical protein
MGCYKLCVIYGVYSMTILHLYTFLSDPVSVLPKILVMASENASVLYFLGCFGTLYHDG